MNARARILAAQAIASTGMAAGGTAGGLLAVTLSGHAATASLPLGAVVVGSGLTAPIAAAITARHGRARALVATYLAGAVGAAVVVGAAAVESLGLLLTGHLLIGGGNSALMLSRYAVADLSAPADRGRAISRSMAALTVGAVLGPNLLGPAGHVARPWGLAPAVGLFLVALVTLTTAAALLARRDALPAARPGPAATPLRPGRTRMTTAETTAVAVLATANLTMVSVMAVAPAHLHAHGTHVGLVGVAISLHVAAMFAGSPIAGRAVDRHGAERVASMGAAALLAGGAAVVAIGTSPRATIGLLILLGLAWNVQVVAGSTLLQAAAGEPAQAPRLEARGEAAMGLGAATGALVLAGPLTAVGGLALLAAVTAIPHGALLLRLGRAQAGASGGLGRARVE